MATAGLPDLPKEVLGQIPTWQAKYGKLKVATVDQDLLVFRSPTRGETAALLKGQKYNSIEAECRLIETILLYPPSYDFGKLAESSFVKLIQTLWGSTLFGNPVLFGDALDNARDRTEQDVDALIDCWICAAFHKTPDYVDSLTEEQLVYHLALAEKILGRELPIEIKGRLSKRPVDPNLARAIAHQQKLERLSEARRKVWEERAGITQQPEKDPVGYKKDPVGTPGWIDTAKENEELLRAAPWLRYRNA